MTRPLLHDLTLVAAHEATGNVMRAGGKKSLQQVLTPKIRGDATACASMLFVAGNTLEVSQTSAFIGPLLPSS